MHATLRQLKVFESVARHLNYTRAAQELHLTQPAVSMQIKQLEDNVGLPLLEQLGKKIYLTEAGLEMYHYSGSISQLLSEADEVMEGLKGLQGGHLRISVASTANSFVTRLLAQFVKRHPSVTFSLDVTNRASLLRQLESNQTDLVIMGKPPDGLDLVALGFMDNPLVIIAAPDHPLACKHKQIPLKDLQHEEFVVREPGSGTRIAMERFLKERGVKITTGMEMNSNEAIKQAVEAGLGLGIVSIHTLELELESQRLVLLDVESFHILRHWHIVHRRGKRLLPVAEAFKRFALDEAEAFLAMPNHNPSQ